MLFNSIEFLLFFPIVALIYFIIPKKIRCLWLLISSYYFYMCWNPKYVILILTSTFITYLCGIIINKNKNERKKKLSLLLGIIINVGILVIFKYANFLLNNLKTVLGMVGFSIDIFYLNIFLPVGISFYIFQALGYLIDVYRGDIKAEKNFLQYALFVSFFPQLVAGPIERSKNLLPQIKNISKSSFNYENFKKGILFILWGFFQKLVIADRIAIIVNNVISNYTKYGFIELLLAIVLFAFQIYCDFGGYTLIAKGTAKIMGIDLMDNFKQPYFAKNIKEFWRRWHISLTTWFTDYIYIPLGGNKKGKYRKYLNITIVFVISGFWHGASWNFVIWGLIHAILLIFYDIFNTRENKKVYLGNIKKIVSIFINFLIVDFAWIFFVSSGLIHVLNIFRYMILSFSKHSIFSLGLDVGNFVILLIALIILLIVDILHEKNICIYDLINKDKYVNTAIKILVYLILAWSTLLLGIYGPAYDANQFIYFQF